MKLDISGIDLNNEKDFKEVQRYFIFYTHFTSWVFIWLILYKLGIFSIKPTLFIYMVNIYLVTQILWLIYNKSQFKIENIYMFIIELSKIILTDVIPMIYLYFNKSKTFNIKEIYIFILILLIYLIF